MSELESDKRGRTVYAPKVRDVIATLNKSKLQESDPRNLMLLDSKRYCALLLESLEMESIVREGSTKPEPVNPQRMAEIEQEVKTIAAHMTSLRGEPAGKKSQ